MSTLFINMQTSDLLLQKWFKAQRNLHQSLRLLFQLSSFITFTPEMSNEIKKTMVLNRAHSRQNHSQTMKFQIRLKESDGQIYQRFKEMDQRNKYIYQLIYVDLMHFGVTDFTTHCFDLLNVFVPMSNKQTTPQPESLNNAQTPQQTAQSTPRQEQEYTQPQKEVVLQIPTLEEQPYQQPANVVSMHSYPKKEEVDDMPYAAFGQPGKANNQFNANGTPQPAGLDIEGVNKDDDYDWLAIERKRNEELGKPAPFNFDEDFSEEAMASMTKKPYMTEDEYADVLEYDDENASNMMKKLLASRRPRK